MRKEIEVYDLRQILKAIYEEKLLSKEKMKNIIREIEEKDNTTIKDVEAIFD